MTEARGLRLAACVGCACATILLEACAAHRPDLDSRVERATAGMEGDAEIEAGLARVRAARARVRTATVVPEAEIRVRNLTANNLDAGESTSVGLRLPLENAFVVAAEREAYERELEEEVARLELSSITRRAWLCTRSVQGHAGQQEQARYDAQIGRLNQVLEWTQQWTAAGTLDPLRSMRIQVRTRRRMAAYAPAGASVRGAPRRDFPLPPLAAGDQPSLVRELEAVRTRIEESHPEPERHAAEARRYEALASRARRRALPWLDHFEVALPIDASNGGDVELRFAVTVPLDSRVRAHAQEMTARQAEAEAERRAAVAELTVRAVAALERIADFEARAEVWRALLALAEAAEQEAVRWLDNRRGDPGDIEQLLDEAYAARMAVLQARERAGEASCDLLAVTGVSLADWPRR